MDKKSQVTLKSNNKSEYNRNILLNYSKGLRLNTSIRPSNVNEMDYNNDLALKSIFKNRLLNYIKNNSNKKVKTKRRMKSISAFSLKKSGISQQSANKSARMKSSRSVKVNEQNDSDEVDEVVKNMYSMSNDRHISVFNTGNEKIGNSMIHEQNPAIFKSEVKEPTKRRFSDRSKGNKTSLADIFGKRGD